jgi:hypothetical protein
MSARANMPAQLEEIDGLTWEPLLAAPWSVLVLGKSDCEHCASYTEELRTFLAGDATYGDVRFGKILLDRGGLVSFKRANPWIAELDVLPYTVIYRQGEKVAEFAGGGIGRLVARLTRVRGEAG